MKQFFALLFLAAFSFALQALPEHPQATVPPSIVDNFTAECRAGFAVIKINKTFEQQYDPTKHAQYYEACASDPDLQEVHFNYMKANYELTGCTFSKAGVVLNGFNSQIKVHRECWSAATTNTWSHGLGFTKLSDSSGAGCPPSDNPTYTDPLDYDGDGEVDACSDPNLENTCPSGFFKYKVSGQCVPIECTDEGSQQSFWAETNLITSNEGIYCDGQCAYKIDSGSSGFQGVSGNNAISGYSTGAVCGQGPGEDWFQQNPLDSDCQTETTTAGNQYITCNDVYGHDPETGATDNTEPPNAKLDDTVTMTDQKVDKAQIQDYDPSTANLENCDPTDSACAARNVVPALVDLEKYRQEQETDRHNKAIEAKEKEAGYLVEAINNLRESNAANAKYLAEHSGGGARAEANVDLDGLIDSAGVPDGTSIQGALDVAGSGVNAAIDGLMNGDGYEQFTLTASDVDYVDKLIAKLQLTGQCQISWELWGHSINFDYCEASERLRPLVNFFVYFTTIFTIFYRVTGSLKLRSA